MTPWWPVTSPSTPPKAPRSPDTPPAASTTTTSGSTPTPPGTHTERLVHAAWTLGQHPGFESLRRWAHMLGFGGHFLTKARHYSVTFAALRAARVLYRRTQPQGPEYSDERFERQGDLDAETTIILARLSYVGSGWKTTGDALLANSAADQARRRHQAGREELAHELASDSPLAG
ncbi:replication initiator [Actinomadura madurae]|uniref:replication initiator n=1 Tax=Actinomadura madurae TaxID=1993 RepID=UPI0035564824